jgi:hypothetical protein
LRSNVADWTAEELRKAYRQATEAEAGASRSWSCPACAFIPDLLRR